MADINAAPEPAPAPQTAWRAGCVSVWSRASSQLGLFARSFLLIALLMLCSLAAWLAVFLAMEIGPRATQMSKRVAASVYLTRTAMTYSTDENNPRMLRELSAHEGLDVYTRAASDLVQALPAQDYWQKVAMLLRQYLGAETMIAWEVNEIAGFWVSFQIEDKKYWLVFEREEIGLTSTIEWISWGAAALLLSLLGAALSVAYLNRPLAHLARFARSVSRGDTPLPLPESGAREIRALNTSFNRMAQDLRKTEHDRELMLAGLSHDLRTPLTRMRLEVELSSASEATRQYIDQDLSQIDQSISKLMEYARAARPQAHTDLDVSVLLESLIARERKQLETIAGRLHTNIAPQVCTRIEPLSLQRIVANLLENALRYGCGPDQPPDLTVNLTVDHESLYLEVSDRGPGIEQADIARVMRPFSRGDMARTGGAGSGLGLAIIERLAHQAGGSLSLKQRAGGGLTAIVRLPRVRLFSRE